MGTGAPLTNSARPLPSPHCHLSPYMSHYIYPEHPVFALSESPRVSLLFREIADLPSTDNRALHVSSRFSTDLSDAHLFADDTTTSSTDTSPTRPCDPETHILLCGGASTCPGGYLIRQAKRGRPLGQLQRSATSEQMPWRIDKIQIPTMEAARAIPPVDCAQGDGDSARSTICALAGRVARISSRTSA